MASRIRKPSKNKKRTNEFLANLNIGEIPTLDEDDNGSDDDDADLESELNELIFGDDIPEARRRKPVQNAFQMDVEKIAMQCMKDIDENEDVNDDDLNDPTLLEELQALTGDVRSVPSGGNIDLSSVPTSESLSLVSLLSERLVAYQSAQSNAKSIGDLSRARRYGRAIDTLENQLKFAKSGQAINEEDIPPMVASKTRTSRNSEADAPARPSRQAPQPPTPIMQPPKSFEQPIANIELPPERIEQPPERIEQHLEHTEQPHPLVQPVPTKQKAQSVLEERRNQYKMAAVQAKKYGDTETAIQYVKIAKQFDVVIEAEQSGQVVDLSNMPPPPTKYTGSTIAEPQLVQINQSTQPEPVADVSIPSTSVQSGELDSTSTDPSLDLKLFNPPPQPGNVLEALQQRLEKYISTRDEAKVAGNSSKVRRLQRIVQQYEVAIKNYKSGKHVDYDDLPAPPGFAPIPLEGNKPSALEQATAPPVPPKLVEVTLPKVPPKPDAVSSTNQDPTTSGRHPKVQRSNTSSILDKQLRFLLERQKLFREAALESKKNGDIPQAKLYLKKSKGFDSMIEATKSGLPIDATEIPTPPQLESDFVIIDKTDVFTSDSSTGNENLYATLQQELKQQIELCERNKNNFLGVGDVSAASKFEKYALETKKDLVLIQHMWMSNERVPNFYYETRLFSLVQCNSDLSDSDLEVTIERGLNLPGKPNELDSYIKVELPIPNDSPQKAKTSTVYNTIEPTFNFVVKFQMNRKSKVQMRAFKRQGLKCDVFSKGGLFSKDAVLGTVNVKLTDLETKCSIHDSFDLMDGRKPCGGKLQVKIRIRDPLLAKQIEEVREKWLIISRE